VPTAFSIYLFIGGAEMEHVRDHVYAELISPGCNVGIVATSTGTLIVDTPLVTRQARVINDAITAAGHQTVRFIVISHPHGDHILGTDLFGKDVLIIGNQAAYEKMGRHDPSWVEEWVKTWTWESQDDVREMIEAHVSQPEVVFEEELTLHLGGVEIWILPLPGHLGESVGVFVPEAKVLVTGDALFCGHHPYMGQGNFQVWFESFNKMRELKAARIVPGHGPVCGNEAIENQQRYMEKMVEVRSKWNPEEGEEAIPASAIDELMGYYPLHGRPEKMMRARIVESIRVAGDPQF
jgi:cyclase